MRRRPARFSSDLEIRFLGGSSPEAESESAVEGEAAASLDSEEEEVGGVCSLAANEDGGEEAVERSEDAEAGMMERIENQ